MARPKELTPNEDEVIKNRVFGMPTTKMTRHQIVSFSVMIKIAYDFLTQDDTKRVFEYDTKEFMKMIGITPQRKQSHLFTKVFIDEEGWEQESDEYSLEKTLKKLIEKTIYFRYKDESGKTYKVEATALLAYFKLTKEKVTFEFSEWIRSRILTINNAYIMKIPILASFRSAYTVILFEQLEQRRDFRRWKVSVNVLRVLFGLDENKYKAFSDFRKYVLEVAKKEIENKANYIINVEYIREGRGGKVKDIVFTWNIFKTSLSEFKEFIRKNFVNTPLLKAQNEEDNTIHIVQVSKDGKLYNANNPDYFYDTKKAEKIWRIMYEKQDILEIKKVNKKSEPDDIDYSKYIGKNLFFEDEMFENIIYIKETSSGKLKVKFYSGETVILTKEEFLKYVLI